MAFACAPVSRQSCSDWTGFHRIPPEQLNQAKTASARGRNVIYDIFEGTAEIQQLVIARAISGMHIK
jgi:alkylation response protein AidB-like acyl-CoA dehydrogenase